MAGIESVPIRCPRVRDRGALADERTRFSSATFFALYTAVEQRRASVAHSVFLGRLDLLF